MVKVKNFPFKVPCLWEIRRSFLKSSRSLTLTLQAPKELLLQINQQIRAGLSSAERFPPLSPREPRGCGCHNRVCTKWDHRVGTPEHVSSGFNGHKLGRSSEKNIHGKMQNCLLVCLKLYCGAGVKEMGANGLVGLIAFTELELRNCKRSCIYHRIIKS